MRAIVVAISLVAGGAARARAASPEGVIDVAEPEHIGGWARDPDHPGPIPVHIYIDGELAHDVLAEGFSCRTGGPARRPAAALYMFVSIVVRTRRRRRGK